MKNQNTQGIIASELSLKIGEETDEKEMLRMLIDRVTELMETDIDLLMSYLYRLDILEEKINEVLSMQAVLPPNEGLARLILERQKQRVDTRKKYRQKPIEGWEY